MILCFSLHSVRILLCCFLKLVGNWKENVLENTMKFDNCVTGRNYLMCCLLPCEGGWLVLLFFV